MFALWLLIAPLFAGTDEVMAHLRADRVEAALNEARKSVEESPDDVEAHELLIDILMNLGIGHQAQYAYEQYAVDNATSAMAWYLLGRASVEADRAEVAYRRSKDLNPGYARAYMGIASVDRARGDLARAEAGYRTALTLDPNLPEAWSGLGALLIQQDRWEEALMVTMEAMDSSPQDPEAYLAAAALDPERSEEHLRRGTKAVPNEPRLWEALAREQINHSDLKGARASLSQALLLNPDSSQARVDWAILVELDKGTLDILGQSRLARARDLARETPIAAEAEFDQLALDYPDCYLVHLNRGHFYAEQDLFSEAARDLKRAYELAPDSPDTQGALGLLYLQDNNAAMAMPLLDKARRARPTDVELAVSACMAHAGVDGVSTGVACLGEVADANPTDIRPVMAMVTILQQTGQADAAYTVLQRAVARTPHPTLLLTYAAAAKDHGDKTIAADTLRELAKITGEDKYATMADELER